jgi:hypothetical protein
VEREAKGNQPFASHYREASLYFISSLFTII